MTTIDHHPMAGVAITDNTRIPVKASVTLFSLMKMLCVCNLETVMRSSLLTAINVVVGNSDEQAGFLCDVMPKRGARNV